MTKTERYMWLVNDLLLTAAAVSLIINLVGQTASGYAFSGSHGQATELLYDAFILLVVAAALGVWLSKWLAPAAAWVKMEMTEVKFLKILVKVVDVILLCFLTVVVCSNLKDYINALRTIKGTDLKVTVFGHVILILVLLTELALAVFSQKIPRKPFLIIGLVCIALTLIGLITPIAFGPGNLPLNFLALVLLAVSRFLQENVAQKRTL